MCPNAVAIRAQMGSRNYLIHGSAAWDDPWLTEHNLAHALSDRGNRVLFVEPPMSLATPLRSGSAMGIQRLKRRGLRDEDGISLLQPLALPVLRNRRMQALGAPIVRQQVRRAVESLELNDPIVISTRDAAGLSGFRAEAGRIYLVKDWIQAGGTLLGRDECDLKREVATMAGWADLVCTISPALQSGLRQDGVDSVVLRHGFHAGLAPLYDNGEEPRELKRLPRPLVGYAGRIDGRLDIELLIKLSRRLGGTLLLVGPVSPRLAADLSDRLRAEPGIELFGTRRRDELPAYLSSLDCSLMPYRDTEWLRYASPLKLWDLLYAGPPIVGSGCLALTEHAPHLLHFATSHDDFIVAVEQAISEGHRGAGRRRQYALENSWDARAAELEGLAVGLPFGG